MQPGESPESPANRVESPSGQPLRDTGGSQCLTNDLHRGARRASRRVHQGEAAKRQARPLARVRPFYINQFERAAAKIADDAIRLHDPGDDPMGRKFRFPAARQKRDRSPDGRRSRSEKFGAIRGIAGSGGCKNMQILDAHDFAQDPETPQSRERLFDAALRKLAGGRDALAERAKRFLIEDRPGRAAQTLIDDEADRVRSNVDDRDRRLRTGWQIDPYAHLQHRVLTGVETLEEGFWARMLERFSTAGQTGVGHEVAMRVKRLFVFGRLYARRSNHPARPCSFADCRANWRP